MEAGTERSRGTSLRLEGVRGLAWTSGSQMSARALHVLFRLALARLLVPRDFGVFAVALVITGFLELLRDAGLGPAVVHRSGLTESETSTLFWTVAGVGAATAAFAFLAAPVVGAVFRIPEVVPVLRLLGLNLLVTALGGFYASVLERRLQFRALAVRRLLATAVGGAGALAAGLSGWSVWALVVGVVLQSTTSLVLVAWYVRWLPRLEFAPGTMLQLWSYGRAVVGTRVFNFLGNSTDALLVGRYLGPASLGIYSLGSQALSLPRQGISLPLGSVGLALFSAAQEDTERCRNAYRDGLEVVMATVWPVLVLGALVAPAAVPFLLGQRWVAIVPVFQILTAAALVQTLRALSSPLFLGLGRPDLGLRWSMVHSLLAVAAFTAGLRWGVVGVAGGYVAASLISLPLNLAFIVRLIGLSWTWLARAVARGLTVAAGLAGVWMLVSWALQPAGGFVRVGLSGATSALAGAGLARMLFPRAVGFVGSALREVTRRRVPAAPEAQ